MSEFDFITDESFRASLEADYRDLEYVSRADAELAKEHLLARLKENVNSRLLRSLSGIGRFIEKRDVLQFVDPLVPVICFQESSELEVRARERLKDEWRSMESDISDRVLSRLDAWIIHLRSKEKEKLAKEVENLKVDLDIPF